MLDNIISFTYCKDRTKYAEEERISPKRAGNFPKACSRGEQVKKMLIGRQRGWAVVVYMGRNLISPKVRTG